MDGTIVGYFSDLTADKKPQGPDPVQGFHDTFLNEVVHNPDEFTYRWITCSEVIRKDSTLVYLSRDVAGTPTKGQGLHGRCSLHADNSNNCGSGGEDPGD